jgi:hypothetical protein
MKSRLIPLLTLLASVQLFGQTTAAVSDPEFVKAGEMVVVTGTLDRAPIFSGSPLMYYFAGPGDFSVQSSVELAAGQRDFSFSYRIPEAAKGGVWSVSRLVFYDGVDSRIVLAIPAGAFNVIANSGLVYPAQAEIALTPSEIQLLRGAALRLQAQIQDLKGPPLPFPSEPCRPQLGTHVILAKPEPPYLSSTATPTAVTPPAPSKSRRNHPLPNTQ